LSSAITVVVVLLLLVELVLLFASKRITSTLQ
jgi:hypothetical protein